MSTEGSIICTSTVSDENEFANYTETQNNAAYYTRDY